MSNTTATLLHGYAVNATYAYAGRNARLTNGRVVHRVHWEPWIDGSKVPAPACRVGIGGWLPWAIEPAAAPVSCRRCLTHAPATVTPHTRDPQMELFELEPSTV